MSKISEISKSTNKKLVKIFRGDMLIDNEENNSDLGPLQLHFDDLTVLQLELDDDGESVKDFWLNGAKELIFSQNSEWFRIELTSNRPFSELIDKKVVGTSFLKFGTKNEDDRITAGYRFLFENGQYLVYHNAGDYARIYFNSFTTDYGPNFVLEWK